ncbi:DUF5017 domain-containing protein [Reichenbachiella ulvae]|uniref:DUF5017 domain-containing protein n=1 Tax=Reichenbachiella ulvae TaxID=2980104 RepID=A0ABT3D014_9BACT|nr:DUF5017 domain-containing protein [Reichenbachiella ulvae]MCV9389291.1 DUF5017 domain-containing protein [Reichenbachiella ulvae]
MKKLINKSYLILGLLAGVFFSSCEESLEFPDVNFSASETTITAGDTVLFTASSGADLYSIYTGDAGHEYSESVYEVLPDSAYEDVTIPEGEQVITGQDTIRGPITMMALELYDFRKIDANTGDPIDFATGFAMSRVEYKQAREFEYIYTTPGIYTVTLVTTNVGRPDNSGYDGNRADALTYDEYATRRKLQEITIVVNPIN